MKLGFNALPFLSLLLIFASSAKADLKVAAYNIRNFDYDSRADAHTDKKELVKIIKSLKADLLGVEEIVNQKALYDLVRDSLKNYKLVLTQCGGRGRQTLGFLYNPQVLELVSFEQSMATNLNEGCDKGSRPMAVGNFKIKESGVKFTAVQVHLKAGARQSSADKRFKQYKAIGKFMKRKSFSKDFIIMGDFNTTDFWKENKNAQNFRNFAEQNSLENTTWEIGCSSYWWGGIDDGLEYPGLLDHILISRSLLRKFNGHEEETAAHCKKVSCEIASSKELGRSFTSVSDHCPMATVLVD